MIICCWSLMGTSAWGQNADAGRLMKPSKSPANMIKTYQYDETIQTSRHQYDWNIHPYSIPTTTTTCILSMKELLFKLSIQAGIFLLKLLNTLWTFQKNNRLLCGFCFNINLFWAEGSVPMWTSERLQCSVKPGWPCLFARPVIPPLSLTASVLALHCTPCCPHFIDLQCQHARPSMWAPPGRHCAWSTLFFGANIVNDMETCNFASIKVFIE